MPETGDRMIDNTLHSLALSAASKGIRLSANVTAPVTEIIGDSLSRTALQTLISDHVKDAVIAVGSRDDKQGNILLNLARDGRVYTLTVLDNGAPFELHVFDKLGRERVTTHSDSGGSGIGFMQTFSTLRACDGSIVITEFESGLPFTKSVGFRFDGKGKFVIKSPRAEQIKNALTREYRELLRPAVDELFQRRESAPIVAFISAPARRFCTSAAGGRGRRSDRGYARPRRCRRPSRGSAPFRRSLNEI